MKSKHLVTVTIFLFYISSCGQIKQDPQPINTATTAQSNINCNIKVEPTTSPGQIAVLAYRLKKMCGLAHEEDVVRFIKNESR